MVSVKKARQRIIEWAIGKAVRTDLYCTLLARISSESQEAQVIAAVMTFKITSWTVPGLIFVGSIPIATSTRWMVLRAVSGWSFHHFKVFSMFLVSVSLCTWVRLRDLIHFL